jgi:hypothetical protein
LSQPPDQFYNVIPQPLKLKSRMLNGNVYLGGNGNGNKFNLRNEILENLLRASGDGSSAKISMVEF